MRLPAGIVWTLVAACLPMLMGSCSAPWAPPDDHVRTVLVDYHHDEFAAVFAAYFPKVVTVRAGDTVLFKQSWSGEPHSITTGTLVEDPFKAFWPVVKDGPPFPADPPATPEFKTALDKEAALPHMASPKSLQLVQSGAQPCYLDSPADLPKDPDTPCTRRAQPAFNGRQAYYSSGMLPYEGDAGNTFRLPIAASTPPGEYHYYCTVHGPVMSGAITVVAAGSAIPSQAEVNQRAQKEVARFTGPWSTAYNDAKAGKGGTLGYLAGIDSGQNISGSVTEFVPRKITSKVGEKVTWTVLGDAHTIAFDVPAYLPEINVGADGTVKLNPQVIYPVGLPGFPTTPSAAGVSPPAIHVNAGNYDGSFFLSSGLGGPGGPGENGGLPPLTTYSVTFTKPGTYKFACLIHPLMVGQVDVK